MKKIIFTCLLFALSLQGAYAAPVEVSCNTYSSTLTNACDQCFDGGFVYEGRGKTVTDTLNNNSSTATAVYLLNENTTVWQADVLQASTTWSTSTDLLRYSSGLNSGTSPTLGAYYYFLPNTSTQFLETNTDRGFRLDNAGAGTNRNAPAYKFQFIANLRSLQNGVLSAPREHRECVFYNPAWCGDGVVDADQGEQCDDGNTDETDGCNNSCQIVTPTTYDLALTKVVNTPASNIAAGGSVQFDITVFNQGTVDANNIEVTDYIPTGLTLNDATWTQVGSLATRTIASITAGNSTTITITFDIDPTAVGNIVNWAEISNDDGSDIDSTPDQNNLNDCHGGDGGSGGGVGTIDTNLDNVITGIGDNDGDGVCEEGEDEDDHDPALITIGDYDLALTKVVSGTTTSFSNGQSVTFNITVTNQGDVTANTIQVIDYIPAGLTLNDPTWTALGSNVVQTLPALAASASTTIPITFTVDGTVLGTITNIAEISADDGQDCDSTPDTDSSNDGTITDNDIGTGCDVGGDEDDHDPASITSTGPAPSIEVLKYSANTSDLDGNTDDSNTTNDTQTVTQNSSAVFQIVVTNNGSEDLQSITLTDVLEPACDRSDAQTQTLISAIGNNDTIFNIGESFRYTCSDAAVPAGYTNTIVVNGVGVTTSTAVTDQDTTVVVLAVTSTSPTPGGGGGTSSHRCHSIATTGTQVTCEGSTRVRSFRVDCDSTSSDDANVFSSDYTLTRGRLSSTLSCPSVNEPICYVMNQENITSIAGHDWRTATSCQQSVVDGGGSSNRCGNGILEPELGEQCETVANDNSEMVFPTGCSNTCQLTGIRTVPSMTGIHTIPIQGGGFEFNINADDIVLGNNMNVADAIGEFPRVTNNSIYDLAIPQLCLVKSSGYTLESAPYIGQSFDPADTLPRHGYCEDMNDKVFYPGETMTMYNLEYNFDTDTSYLDGRSDDYNDNILAFTLKDDEGKIYDTAYFSPTVRVRVAKPTISTTAGTTYIASSTISNLSKVAEDIIDAPSSNFGGVTIADEADLGDTGTVYDDENIVQEVAEDFNHSRIQDLSEPSSRLGAYNGIENIQIINGTDLSASQLPATLTQATTFIIENADFIVDQNIEYDYNVAFVVRGGNIIVHDDVTHMQGAYIVIPKTSDHGNILGVNETNIQLVIEGSLYADSSDLISKRAYIRSSDDRNGIHVGTVVSFGSSFFRDPAPLLGKFIFEYTESVKVAQ